MGLTVVNKVLVNGHKVNGPLGSVECFNSPINEDMVPRESACRDLKEKDSSVRELVHEAGQESSFSGKMVGVHRRFGLVG